MEPTEIVVAGLGLLGTAVISLFAFMRGSKADKETQEDAANATVYGGYSGLVGRLQEERQRLEEENAELRRRLAEAEKKI